MTHSSEDGPLTDSIIADFGAVVGFSVSTSDETTRGRVAMTKAQLLVETDDETRRIDVEDVFDVVRDVSRTAAADSTETVTLAFDAGGDRGALSLQADAATLVTFQRLLFTRLLTGTDVTVTHRRANDDADERRPCRLRISAADIRLDPVDDEPGVVVRRDEVARFALSGTEAPEVVLYLRSPDRVERVSVRFPSFRLLNLFGRYLRADLLANDAIGSAPERARPIGVLLVDDDEQSRELTTVFLNERSDRLSILEASSARAALDVLAAADRRQAVDCVVSDYKMPGMDGIEFLNAVREEHPTLPFILYTGQGSERVAKQAILDDVTDYVEKDVGPGQYEVLASRIEKAVR